MFEEFFVYIDKHSPLYDAFQVENRAFGCRFITLVLIKNIWLKIPWGVFYLLKIIEQQVTAPSALDSSEASTRTSFNPAA
jgi:hypothetical protein